GTAEAAVPTWFLVTQPLSHYRGVFGFDLVEDADFAGLAVRILIDAKVLLGELVDAVVGAIFGDFRDAAADFQIAIRIIRIDDGEGDTRIAADVLILLAAPGRVEDDMLTIEVDPDRSDLRPAVGHESGEVGKGPFLE